MRCSLVTFQWTQLELMWDDQWALLHFRHFWKSRYLNIGLHKLLWSHQCQGANRWRTMLVLQRNRSNLCFKTSSSTVSTFLKLLGGKLSRLQEVSQKICISWFICRAPVTSVLLHPWWLQASQKSGLQQMWALNISLTDGICIVYPRGLTIHSLIQWQFLVYLVTLHACK